MNSNDSRNCPQMGVTTDFSMARYQARTSIDYDVNTFMEIGDIEKKYMYTGMTLCGDARCTDNDPDWFD